MGRSNVLAKGPGAGDSFNDGVVADDSLVSLDDFGGVVWKDLGKKHLTFKGGTRVRDVIRFVLDDGLAFSAQPSHDAQSIGGILSTDVHGTGRDWGFVSEAVVGPRVIDAKGNVRDCPPAQCAITVLTLAIAKTIDTPTSRVSRRIDDR